VGADHPRVVRAALGIGRDRQDAAADGHRVGCQDAVVAWSARALRPARRVQAGTVELVRPAQNVQARRRGRGRRRADRERGRDRGGRSQRRAPSRTSRGVGALRDVVLSTGQPRRARACAMIRRPERTAIRVVP
jgi:hypothetical protein